MKIGKMEKKVNTFDKIKSIIYSVVCGVNSRDDVKLKSNLKRDLGADSLDIAEIRIRVKNEFGVFITDDAFKRIKTVRGLVGYINAHHSA